MARLLERYKSEIAPALMKQFEETNLLVVPRLQKIVISMGVGEAIQDKKRLEEAVENMGVIAGQRPIVTKARQPVAGFKIRKGYEIGCMVTVRGRRMYEFLDRLISVAIPRIRDFRGMSPTSFDGNGNYSLGVTEQIVFPEVDPDNVTVTQGMNITICMSGRSDERSRALLTALGMPFRES